MSMIVDLTGVLKEAGNKISVDGNIELDDVKYLGEDFHFVRPAVFKGSISNSGKSLALTGTVTLCLKVRCARCAKELEKELSYELDEALIREEDNTDPDGDAVVFSGNEIDLTQIAETGFFMNVPGKFLCSDDCKGLCPQCGADLNLGDCGCDKDDIDPRWEALKKIMDSNKD